MARTKKVTRRKRKTNGGAQDPKTSPKDHLLHLVQKTGRQIGKSMWVAMTPEEVVVRVMADPELRRGQLMSAASLELTKKVKDAILQWIFCHATDASVGRVVQLQETVSDYFDAAMARALEIGIETAIPPKRRGRPPGPATRAKRTEDKTSEAARAS
jgi:hypothetical protein